MADRLGLLLRAATDLLRVGLGLLDDRPDVLRDDRSSTVRGLPHLSVLLVAFLTFKHALDSPFSMISRRNRRHSVLSAPLRSSGSAPPPPLRPAAPDRDARP